MKGAIDFLTFLFESGLEYSAWNTATFALSAILPLFNGIKFGEDPLFSRFLEGVYKPRPALLRYKSIWNVGEVLNYLTTLKQVPELSLKDLTLKLIMLLCLLTAQRCQTVHLLDTKYIHELEGKYHITGQQKLKQSRPGQHLEPIVLLKFVSDQKILSLLIFGSSLNELRFSTTTAGIDVSTYQPTAVEQLLPHRD